MIRTFLSLGSNVGSREQNLRNAISKLDQKFNRLAISGIYQTAPQDYLEQDDFFNIVACYEIGDTSPDKLLEYIHQIENDMGRTNYRKIFKGPRPIDIDIIYIDDYCCQRLDLIIPHKSYLQRNFVLVPLKETILSFNNDNDFKWLSQIDENILKNNDQKVELILKF